MRYPMVKYATLALTLAAAAAPAQKFQGDMPFIGDFYGRSVAIDGNVAVVGVPGDNTVAAEAGAVYVYQHNGTDWNFLQKLLGPDIGDQFGFSVAVEIDESGLNEGDFIAVGSLFGNGLVDFSGNVSIYRRTDPDPMFSFQQTVFAADGIGFDEFGYSIALDLSVPGDSLSGDPVYTLAVGAPDDESGVGQDSGAVYVYQASPDGSAWAGITKLVPADIAGGDLLGRSVDISGDVIIAGAAGMAYLIRRFFDTGAGFFNWEVNNRLKASDGGAEFGVSVGVSGSVPVVGAPFADSTPNGFEGAVYVFGGMPAGFDVTESQKILPPDLATAFNFGIRVAIDRNLLAISEVVGSGRTHIYREQSQNNWVPLEILTTGDPAASQAGINAMALSLPNVIAGDPIQNSGGAAYILTNQVVFKASFED